MITQPEPEINRQKNRGLLIEPELTEVKQPNSDRLLQDERTSDLTPESTRRYIQPPSLIADALGNLSLLTIGKSGSLPRSTLYNRRTPLTKEQVIKKMRELGHFQGTGFTEWLREIGAPEEVNEEEVRKIFAKMSPISEEIIKNRGEY